MWMDEATKRPLEQLDAGTGPGARASEGVEAAPARRRGRKRTGPVRDLSGMRFGKLTVLGPTRDSAGRVAWRCRCECGNETVVLGSNLLSGRTESCGCGRARLDLAGMRFGKLTALEPAEHVGRYTAWKCRCDCGNEVVARTSSLTSGKTKSCGCLRDRRLDLTGDTYGKLTVLGRAPDVGGQAAWLCRCECGNEVVVRMCDLRTGHTKSCGCLARGEDLTGRKFGRLTVIGRAESRGRSSAWRCSCTCGKEVVVRADNLISGGTRSCGCLRKDMLSKRTKGGRTHGRA